MDEVRVWDGVKESSKKKLVRSTWAGHVEKMGDEKRRGQVPRKCKENEARKIEITMGIALKMI